MLKNKADGGSDFFWCSRDSALLIRGGANYSYEQINAELQARRMCYVRYVRYMRYMHYSSE